MRQEIRYANISDIDMLVKLRFDYFEIEQMPVMPEQRATIEANLRTYIEKHLMNDFFVALVYYDGEIASTAFLSIIERPPNPNFPTGKTGTVYNVFTYPKYQRHGYATQAMQMLLNTAKENNLSSVDLSASEQGLSLYQKLGFKIDDHTISHFVDMKLVF